MQHSVRQLEFGASLLLAFIMAIIAYNTDFGQMLPENAGFCLTAPSSWHLFRFISWAANLILIFGAVLLTVSLNQRFYFIQTADLLMPAVLALLICAFPWLCKGINSSNIVLVFVILAIYMIFSCYDDQRSTQETFVIASLLSFGSMFQYAFVFYIPVCFIAGFMVRSFQLKTLPAFILGLVAPYWCLIGIGAISLSSLHFPKFYTLNNAFASYPELKMVTIACIVIGVAWLVMVVKNSLDLLRDNANARQFNNIISLFGLVSFLMMLIDFDNLEAYIGVALFCLAQQISLTLGRNRDRLGIPILIGVALVSLFFFITSVVIY